MDISLRPVGRNSVLWIFSYFRTSITLETTQPLKENLNIWSILVLFFIFTQSVMAQAPFDLQGHRGCRGLMPENTLPAFIRAVELGVTTLELDVVISGDGQIIVSHEPWMSSEICIRPDGKPIDKDEEKTLNLYKMPYSEIQTYECGLLLHPKFPHQTKINAVKPSLKMAVRMVRSFAEDNKYPQPKYNIEIKSNPKDYNTFQPDPAKFVELVVTEIKRLGIEEITTLQSFDLNVLEELNKKTDRKFKISYLVEKGKLKKNLAKITFKPNIYSPLYTLVNQETVTECHAQGIKIIPWTINEIVILDKMKAWGCDGAITDFPDVVR
jgi:glycerophosphoryl diester phosphodiesterase